MSDTAMEAFGGHYPLDNFVRLLLCMTAIVIFMVCIKIGLQSWRLRKDTEERQRAWGAMAFALIVAAPAFGSLTRFGTPLPWSYAIPYLLGLFCACVSLGYRVSISPPWLEFWARRQERRAARRRK